MNKKEQNKLLMKYINAHPMAKNIKVEIFHNRKSFKPRTKRHATYYSDVDILVCLLSGAEYFCSWLRLNGYSIGK